MSKIKAISQIRKSIILFFLFAFVFLLSACFQTPGATLPYINDYEQQDTSEDRKHLKVGVVPGPYGDMFMAAIYPSLSAKGYTAELVFYDNFSLPNIALADAQIDLNIFQHYRYLNNFKFEHDLSLSAIAEIPTVSMGIYSNSLDSLADLPNIARVSLPNDNTNYARALIVLENAGIIRLNPEIDKTKAKVTDIVSNPNNILLVPLEAHTLVASLPDFDLSIINGNFALSGGLSISEALYNEHLDADFFNVIAVRTEDLGEPFVLDIIMVLRSDEYRDVIMDKNEIFFDFQRPLNFYMDME